MNSQPHQWTRITQQPVDVIVAPDGQPYPVDRPNEPVGEAVGCECCGVPLTSAFVHTPCVPDTAPVAA